MLIVCERKNRLTSALRRVLRGLGLREAELNGRRAWLRQRATLVESERLLEEAPASLLLIEVCVANLAESLDWLVRCQRDRPAARTAVLLAGEIPAERHWPAQSASVAARTDVEWALREAGASSIIGSMSQLLPIAELALRHRAQSPEPATAWFDSIWARLPWEASSSSISQSSRDTNGG